MVLNGVKPLALFLKQRLVASFNQFEMI